MCATTRSRRRRWRNTIAATSCTAPRTMSTVSRKAFVPCTAPLTGSIVPTLRVGETLEFAATTRTPQRRLDGWSRKHMISYLTDVAMTVFGLRHARNTKVGDASIRGVSGGEKKRVSISEPCSAAPASRLGTTPPAVSMRAPALEFGVL